MMIYIGIIVFIFGLIIGSFLNVIIVRMYTGRTIGGRSVCMSCQRVLRWYDLIPLISFLILRGRCSQCDARISTRYFFVELITGGVFLCTWLAYGFSVQAFIYGGIGVLLIVLSVYDWRHKIIPNFFPYVLIVLGILALIFSQNGYHVYPLVFQNIVLEHIFSAFLIPMPFFLLWLFSRGRWFGLGDVKLMIAIGLFMGVAQGIEVVIIAFWLAMLYVLIHLSYNGIWRALQKQGLVRKTQKRILSREIPFGPFLSLSFFMSLIGIHVFQIFF